MPQIHCTRFCLTPSILMNYIHDLIFKKNLSFVRYMIQSTQFWLNILNNKYPTHLSG